MPDLPDIADSLRDTLDETGSAQFEIWESFWDRLLDGEEPPPRNPQPMPSQALSASPKPLTAQWRAHATVLNGPATTDDAWVDGEIGREKALAEAQRMTSPRLGRQYTNVHIQRRWVSEPSTHSVADAGSSS